MKLPLRWSLLSLTTLTIFIEMKEFLRTVIQEQMIFV